MLKRWINSKSVTVENTIQWIKAQFSLALSAGVARL